MKSFEDIVAQKSLTRKQQDTLEAILFLIRKGELPTVREVGALVGLRSPATVLKHLRVLEQRGLISLSGKSRGIRIADERLLEQVFREPDRPADSPDVEGGHTEPLESASSADILQAHLPHAIRLGARYDLKAGGLRSGGGSSGRVALVGAIAAGQPFESYAEGFETDWFNQEYESDAPPLSAQQSLAVDPAMFAQSGELFALQIQGDSMIDAGILNGDYVIIRRQNEVEEGEIAAVLIDGEGTLKRWTTVSGSGASGSDDGNAGEPGTVRLLPENERFDPIEVTSEESKDVLVIGKYVGLVRGELQLV